MKKHIIILTDEIVMGGVETVLLTLLQGLLETQKYNISLIVTRRIEDSFFLKKLSAYDIRILEPFSFSEKPRNIFIKLLWKIKRGVLHACYKMKRYQLFLPGDLLIDFKNGAFNAVLSKIGSRAKIMWIHGSFLYVQKHMNFDFSHYTKVVCLTKSLMDKMSSAYPLLESKFIQIYNPFDFALIREQAEDVEGLSRGDLDLISEPYFLHIGRLHPDKDIKTLLDAYEQFVGQTHSRIKLYILGEGDLLIDYQNMVLDKGLESYVVFLGGRCNPHVWTKRAKALILSSPSEGLSCVLVESMILGTLAISSDCPDGPAEVLEHGQCGVLFEVGHVKQLAQIMVDIEEGKLSVGQFAEQVESSLHRFDKYHIQQQVNTLMEDCLKLN